MKTGNDGMMTIRTEQAASALNEKFGNQTGFEAFYSSSAVGMRLPGKEQKVYILHLLSLEGGDERVFVSYNDATGLIQRTQFPDMDAAVQFLEAEARASGGFADHE